MLYHLCLCIIFKTLVLKEQTNMDSHMSWLKLATTDPAQLANFNQDIQSNLQLLFDDIEDHRIFLR